MLLAFLFQSYAGQTHIHFLNEAATISAALADDGAAAAQTIQIQKNKHNPTPDNPDTCPLCQLLYGGQYVAPNALIFFLPTVAVSVIQTTAGFVPHYDAASHNWLGRAPPRD
jgi:hypothetical protein